MISRITLLLCAIVQDSVANKYILPALGLGGDNNSTAVKIAIIISNPNTHVANPVATLISNNTAAATFTAFVDADATRSGNLEGFQELNLLNGSELANKSIQVLDISHNFNLFVIYEHGGHSEGFAAISTSDLGSEYYISTFCELGGYCTIALATSILGLTRVYIKLPDEVNEVVICVGEKYWRSKYHTSINLTYPETLQIETTHDLTGSYIFSDNPVAVVAGTRSMLVQGGSLLHFSEQLTPVPHWGMEFVVRGFQTEYGCIIHITSSARRTIVEMTGFRTVEMSGNGQTLKRRLEDSAVSYIKTKKPVQVMMYVGVTYGSYADIQSVGMTLIPAMRHFKTKYVVSCCGRSTFFQYVLMNGHFVQGQGHHSITITKVISTDYQVHTLNMTSSDPGNSMVSSDSPFGGIIMCGNAVFPLGPLLNTASPGCTEDIPAMVVGDGLDNDCDGAIDEDYCFENIKVTYTFIPGNSDKILTYMANVTGFYELLLRIQSCDTTQVELKESGTGKVVIHISWSQILVYECFPNCENVQQINTTDMFINRNCHKDVVFYWIMQVSGVVCVDIGHRNLHGNCLLERLAASLSSELVEMRLSGIMTNATFWYDMYSADCVKFSSDWRCADAVANCYEYDDDLCTNPNYTDWVDHNCRQFCGICSTDSFGRMFVYIPLSSTNPQDLILVGSDGESSRIGVQTSISVKSTSSVTMQDGHLADVPCAIVTIDDTSGPVFIFTEDDVVMYYNSGIYNGMLRLLQPLDALGSEYMTLSFATQSSILTCYATTLHPGTTISIFTSSKTISHAIYSTFYELLSFGEQTGTLMTGNKPFAVFCGTEGNSEYGPSWFQLASTRTWGTSYITPSLGDHVGTSIRSKIKIVTNNNNTRVEVHGDFDGIYVLLTRGDSQELETNPTVVYTITANFPVGVAIMFYNSVDHTDSSFHIIPASVNFMDSPVLIGEIQQSSIAASLTETTNIGDVTYYDIVGLPYPYFKFKSNNAGAFLLYRTGETFGTAITTSTALYKDLYNAQICRLGNGAVGDGFDTDCDGLVDEETVCYTGYGVEKQDSDLDGAFGEDCETVESGSPTVIVPKKPSCLVIDDRGPNCWQKCQCKCSWSEELATYHQMNQSEKDAHNQAEYDKIIKQLRVDEESLSSTLAQKQSADDERMLSISIGVAGVITIFVVLGMIVVFDCISIFKKFEESKSRTEVKSL